MLRKTVIKKLCESTKFVIRNFTKASNVNEALRKVKSLLFEMQISVGTFAMNLMIFLLFTETTEKLHE